jgi:hypothetical protein
VPPLFAAPHHMPRKRTRSGPLSLVRLLAVGCWAAGVCGAGFAASPQDSRDSPSTLRLVSAKEGRKITAAALQQDEPVRGAQDCSHVVHEIYALAGYDYPYANSFDLYAGHRNFQRVRHAQPGDLIAWRGHVGIVVDPKQHRFYSLVRSGLQTEDYLAPYWRSRGTPHFFRYVLASNSAATTANAVAPSSPKAATGSLHHMQRGSQTTEIREDSEQADSAQAAEETALRSKVFNTPADSTPSSLPPARSSLAKSSSSTVSEVSITSEARRPTAAEVLAGVTELNSDAANVLRASESPDGRPPIIIIDTFQVQKVQTKRDKGWANVRIDSHVTIAGEAADLKRRHEMVRWELRRDASGWVALAPTQRTYIARDAAVRVLAAQLAEMTQTEAAAQHDETVIAEETRLANLLSALLNK